MCEPTVAGSIEIAADPDVVYRLIVDLSGWWRFVAEARVSGWRTGIAAAPGAVFTGWNRNGPLMWRTTATVVTARQGRCFAFRVTVLGMPVAD
ncbi:SRPBCC family protein [Nonomuraea rubra]